MLSTHPWLSKGVRVSLEAGYRNCCNAFFPNFDEGHQDVHEWLWYPRVQERFRGREIGAGMNFTRLASDGLRRCITPPLP